MKYMGSKDRHAEEILQVVLAGRRPGQTYVEPFVGGANVIKYVPQEQGPRIGADVNEYMVALHTALASGWEPPEKFSKTEYLKMQRTPFTWAATHGEYGKAIVGFVATGCTFGSTWMGAWATDYGDERTDVNDKSRCAQSRRSCLRDAPGLRGATFVHASYDKLDIPPESLMYCDPPYANTSSYVGDRHVNRWKVAPFWQWADSMVDAGHDVYVSEYSGPTAECMALPDDPEVLGELRAAQEAHKIAQGRDWRIDEATGTVVPAIPAAAPDEIDAAFRRVQAAQDKLTQARQRLADRWEVVWSKEVTADFSASREAGVKAGKVEVEKLFHREA